MVVAPSGHDACVHVPDGFLDVTTSIATAAVAAGGHVVSADRARAWWVLADVEGNEACVCTWLDRG